eukprot:scaffold123507_cov21-Tisochrysis_lutea.AAC.1
MEAGEASLGCEANIPAGGLTAYKWNWNSEIDDKINSENASALSGSRTGTCMQRACTVLSSCCVPECLTHNIMNDVKDRSTRFKCSRSGDEVLYVRPDAVFNKSKPISGGLPHCFPQCGCGHSPGHRGAIHRHCCRRVTAVLHKAEALQRNSSVLAYTRHGICIVLRTIIERRRLKEYLLTARTAPLHFWSLSAGPCPACALTAFGPGPMQQHGFARNLDWAVASTSANPNPDDPEPSADTVRRVEPHNRMPLQSGLPSLQQSSKLATPFQDDVAKRSLLLLVLCPGGADAHGERLHAGHVALQVQGRIQSKQGIGGGGDSLGLAGRPASAANGQSKDSLFAHPHDACGTSPCQGLFATGKRCLKNPSMCDWTDLKSTVPECKGCIAFLLQGCV